VPSQTEHDIAGEHQAVAAVVTSEGESVVVVALVEVAEAKVLLYLIAVRLFVHLRNAELALVGASSGNGYRKGLYDHLWSPLLCVFLA